MSSPIIFEKGTRDFSTLGLGLLSDAIQATTTEELNGQFIFEMDYPVSGNNADLIKENRIIVVNSGHILKRQGFIIRQIVRKIDLTMTVYAEHVSYATLDVALAPMGTISGDAKTALENWKRMLVPAVDFTVDSDILTTNSTSIGAPEFETARQGLGGHAGSILDVWGGEYQFDNWHIRLLKQRGKSANAIIAYGRNLISFEQDTNIADTYTSVYPYYQENSGDDGNKTHFLPERTVDSEFVGKYPNPKVLMLDLSNKFKDVADYSETKLRNYALSYIQSNNIGVPKVNMKISTVDLSRVTGGFSEDIDLGDTVNVYFEKLGITTSAKVIKAVWNVLSDDYDKFEIGARRASLTESVSELATTADENANKALNQALVALQSADGKTTIYYLNSSDPWPTNPNENDTAFVKDGENSIMYRYMFNNDTGVFSWVKILDSMSADQIKQRVSDALELGKAYSDQLVADNVAQVNAVLDDVQAKQADLTAQQAELDTKAQGYANKALADAKANTLATATQTAKDASDALAKAKTDLTTSLNKEVTERTNAVTALDTKAKGYADTAKADAISASTTADGVINKKIDDTASSITSTISQNKADADGKITTAQSTAQQALDGLSTKVSQTVYDAKTGQLQTDLNTTTATANQAKTDIASIKSDNTKQDARMLTIEQTAEGQKTTISNLTTEIGKTNGSVATLKSRADGFEATVTKVNNLSVGGRNLLIGTNSNDKSSLNGGNGSYTKQYVSFNKGYKYTFSYTTASTDWAVYMFWGLQKDKFVPNTDYVLSFMANVSTDIKPGILFSNGAAQHNFVKQVTSPTILSSNGDQKVVIQLRTNSSIPDESDQALYINGFVNKVGTFSIWDLKIETGNLPTDWTPAPEDLSSATAKAQLTADNATLALSNYKTDADGRISKAQADITANATAISQKVSQSDYNQKTGELSGKISEINQTAGKISQTVSDVKAQVDGLSVGGRNLLLNSKDFAKTPDWTSGKEWYIGGTLSTDTYQGLSVIQTNGAWGGPKYAISDLFSRGIVNTKDTYILSAWIRNTSTTITDVYFFGGTQVKYTHATLPANSDWIRVVSSPFTVTNDGGTVRFEPGLSVTGGYIQQAGLKLEKGNIPTDWSPAPEDTDNKISTVSQTVDDITSIISNPTTGLSKRVQTAEGSISTVQSNVSDLQSKQTQTANGLTTEISNRQTGDTNTLTQAKDFTTSSISNSESGVRSLITQTSDSIIAKVDTKTDSATVLSLLKDNWSIGITGNTNKLASGIAADPSAMAIVSQKVIIDSPQTQITGTAWINSAMIGNGQIGNAQIGDAAITSAKIASLDVAKLTGNVSSFIQSNWNGVFASTMIDNTGMSINGGNTTTKFDTSGAHYSNSSGISATYSFGKWSDQSGRATSSTGLYLGATGSENAFINILGTNGSAALVLAGSAMDYGANLNVMQGTLNSYVNVNIRTQLHFKGNKYNSPSYIEINESNRTFNFWTGGGSVGGGNYFYFNQNVISAGTFSSTSVLSKKNVKSVYDEDALGEIAKTQLVNFEYKNRIGQNHVSPIIDDVNSEKEYYIPKTILGQDNEYVDMYSMISMAWRALQQVNDRLEKLESR